MGMFKSKTVRVAAPLALVMLASVLAGCSGEKSLQQAAACRNGIDTAYREFSNAKSEGFGGAVNMTKAGSLLGAAKIQEQFEKYPNCIDKVKRARQYIAQARSGK